MLAARFSLHSDSALRVLHTTNSRACMHTHSCCWKHRCMTVVRTGSLKHLLTTLLRAHALQVKGVRQDAPPHLPATPHLSHSLASATHHLCPTAHIQTINPHSLASADW
jgi:hypothetical protein